MHMWIMLNVSHIVWYKKENDFYKHQRHMNIAQTPTTKSSSSTREFKVEIFLNEHFMRNRAKECFERCSNSESILWCGSIEGIIMNGPDAHHIQSYFMCKVGIHISNLYIRIYIGTLKYIVACGFWLWGVLSAFV